MMKERLVQAFKCDSCGNLYEKFNISNAEVSLFSRIHDYHNKIHVSIVTANDLTGGKSADLCIDCLHKAVLVLATSLDK